MDVASFAEIQEEFKEKHWKSPEDPTFGLLKLTPWRIELSSLNDLIAGTPAKVWRP
jgi:hypothetical protein